MLDKPRSRLFAQVTQSSYSRNYERLLKLRKTYPGYRDDELLMYMVCEELAYKGDGATITLTLNPAQLTAIGILMGLAKGELDTMSGPTNGIWKHLEPVSDQIRAQLRHSHPTEEN